MSLVVSLLLITVDYYYSNKSKHKDFEIKLDNQLLDSEHDTNKQHHEKESSPCGM